MEIQPFLMHAHFPSIFYFTLMFGKTSLFLTLYNNVVKRLCILFICLFTVIKLCMLFRFSIKFFELKMLNFGLTIRVQRHTKYFQCIELNG